MHIFISRLDYQQSLAVALSGGRYSPDDYQRWLEVIRKDGSNVPEQNLGHRDVKIISENQLMFDGKTFSYKEEEVKNPDHKYWFDEASRNSINQPLKYCVDHTQVILFVF